MGDLKARRKPAHWLDSPVPWAASLFVSDDHLGMTKDRGFQDNFLHILLERRPSWAR